MIITIQDLDGETFDIECESTEYVDDLRDKVEELHGIPSDAQRYSLDGKPIDDTDTLEDCGITDGCKLIMEPCKITIILPTKKKLRIVRCHRSPPLMFDLMPHHSSVPSMLGNYCRL